jgi:hypothetical protein
MLLCITTSHVDWLAWGTLLGTFAAAYATFKTVSEIRKQREASYRPEIYLGDMLVYFNSFLYENEVQLPFAYSLGKPTGSYPVPWQDRIVVHFHNLGYGSAKAVEYTWEFDVDGALEMINKVNKNGFFHIHKDAGMRIQAPKYGYMHAYPQFMEAFFSKKVINYILPASLEKDATQVLVPPPYLDLYAIYWCSFLGFYDSDRRAELGQSFDFDNNAFPPLNLLLSYKDLVGKIHRKKFKMHFQMGVTRYPIGNQEPYGELGYQSLIVQEDEK